MPAVAPCCTASNAQCQGGTSTKADGPCAQAVPPAIATSASTVAHHRIDLASYHLLYSCIVLLPRCRRSEAAEQQGPDARSWRRGCFYDAQAPPEPRTLLPRARA